MASPMKFTASFDKGASQRLQNKLKRLQTPITNTTANKLGKTIVAEMKKMISKGISPIKGQGRFDAYKGEYKKRIAKYGYITNKDGKHSKRLRPVNLKLSGKFLKSLKHKVVKGRNGGFGVSVGYRSKDSFKKERGHREKANNQAFRPTIPQAGAKEQWAARIQEIIIRFFDLDVKKITSKK